MGWTHISGASKQDVVAELTASWDRNGRSSKTLAHRVIGNRLWWIISHTDLRTGAEERIIALALLSCDRSVGYGYKDMSESMGPAYYDCPLKYLSMVTPPLDDRFSKGWREKVVAHHWQKKARRQAIKNVQIGGVYKLLRSAARLGGRVTITDIQSTGKTGKGRRYIGTAGGNTYSVPASRIGEQIL